MPLDDTFRLDLDKVVSLVSSARRLLAGGKLLDLSALEGRVEDLCRAVDALERGQALEARPELALLLDDLDRLRAELTQQYTDIGKNADCEYHRLSEAHGAYLKAGKTAGESD